MSTLSIKLSRQLQNFLNDNKIITKDDKDKEEYIWHFGLKYYVSQGMENRVVNAIVTKWEQDSIEDIRDFQIRLEMGPEEVVTMVRDLVDTNLLMLFGAA
ncbi:hypothetical protein BGX38DRAFT_1267061 [Terfezia claveryi]|nr:hypothetical protein BGX38DRAFT_1267061 [Terfezia claveryi]